MAASKDDAGSVTEELLEQLAEDAGVLAAVDEAEDVALDLHETPFSPTTRQRTLRWLNSDQYTAAANKYRTLEAGARPGQGGGTL